MLQIIEKCGFSGSLCSPVFFQVIFVTAPVLGLHHQSEEYSILISPLSLSLGSSSVFSGVLIAAEVDGVGEKGSGGNTTVDVQILLKAF
jgi:hypothetical protein